MSTVTLGDALIVLDSFFAEHGFAVLSICYCQMPQMQAVYQYGIYAAAKHTDVARC